MDISAIIDKAKINVLPLFHSYTANILHITHVYFIEIREICRQFRTSSLLFFMRFRSMRSDYALSYS